MNLDFKKLTISVTGLGYVGLPLALEFAKSFRVIAYDIDKGRISLMKRGIDPSNEIHPELFKDRKIKFTNNSNDLVSANFHIICVPTDIKENNVPNLNPLIQASKSVGQILKQDDIVVYESTVYPGCTEEECIPILEQESGLRKVTDFKYAYSPERISPGDKEKTLTKITKIVSACDAETLEVVSEIYGSIIEAGIFRASTIKVAEAAKVIENVQRDINISLVNELAIIFDKLNINTAEVIEAASTKWNFHKYHPGLVGGHCISVDPFYLIYKAKQIGHDPQVIAAGRRVNDYIPHYIAKKLVQTLIEEGKNPGKCKVLVMGITFKEDVSDIRNSKVVDMIKELESFFVNVHTIDPHASIEEVSQEYGINLVKQPETKYDAIVVAVGHKEYKLLAKEDMRRLSKDKIILFDIKGILNREMADFYWTL